MSTKCSLSQLSEKVFQVFTSTICNNGHSTYECFFRQIAHTVFSKYIFRREEEQYNIQ